MPHGRTPRHRRKKARGSDREAVHLELGPGGVRLQRLLAAAGLASRRGAEELIREGRVTVNGRTARVGDAADPSRDEVALDGERIAAEPPIYWMLNKPTGVLSAVRDARGRTTVLDLLPGARARVYPVGRLDSDTEGLVLLTNDGALAHTLLHPSLGSEREYRVTARGEVSPRVLRRLERGVRLDDGMTAPATTSRAHYDADRELTTFHLVLGQGKKRQIRRMLQAVRHPVQKLVRVRMGPLRLGRLPRGEARPLRRDELRALQQHAEHLREAGPGGQKAGPRGREAAEPKGKGGGKGGRSAAARHQGQQQ